MTTLNSAQSESKPISDRRFQANRENAKHSTGPKTVEGKERSRRNAVKHGLAATMIDAPGLDPEIVRKRTDGWMDVLNPQGDVVETCLIEMAVRMSFRLERCDHAMKQLAFNAKRELEEGIEDEERDDRNGPAEQYKLLMRYEINTERTLSKLVRDLRKRAKIAKTEAERPEPIPAQTQPNSARNEANAPKPVPPQTEPAAPKSSKIDVYATPAKPLNPPLSRKARRKAARYGSARPR